MSCIYTGDDDSFCTCTTCRGKRGESLSHPIRFDDINALLRKIRETVAQSKRRRPCPTGVPGDDVVPYQPSRCSKSCTCCAWCRGEDGPDDTKWCTCPISIPESNCERGHSGLVKCLGGCKPRPIAVAVVVTKPSVVERVLGWAGRLFR